MGDRSLPLEFSLLRLSMTPTLGHFVDPDFLDDLDPVTSKGHVFLSSRISPCLDASAPPERPPDIPEAFEVIFEGVRKGPQIS